MGFSYAEFVETFYVLSHKEHKKYLRNKEMSSFVSSPKLLSHNIQILFRRCRLNVLDTSVTSGIMDTCVKLLPGGWRKLRNEKLNNFCYLTSEIQMIN
jgi:hypothetical protein